MSSEAKTDNVASLLKHMGDVRHRLMVSSNGNSGTATPDDHKLENTIGYSTTVFPDKQSQAVKVQELLEENGFIPQELIASEVAWFYEKLGIDDTYFAMEEPKTIASNILSLYGAKITEYTQHTGYLKVDLQKRTEDGAVFIHSSPPGVSRGKKGTQWERLIDEEYLNRSQVDNTYRLETYRSTGSETGDSPEHLRCYFLRRCQFVEPRPDRDSPEFRQIRKVSDKTFLSKVSEHTLGVYQGVMDQALQRQGPVIEMFEVVGTQERRIVIGYRMGTTSNFFSALSDLYHYYGLYSSRKYVEQFSNDVTIISIYLNPMPNSQSPPIENSIYQILKEVSLIYVLPDNPFFMTGDTETTHAVQEATYAYVGWLFAQHFCNRLGPAYEALRKVLDESDSHQAGVLHDIKLRLREETYTRQLIFEVIQSFPVLVRLLYVHFANIHYPGRHEKDLMPTLSHQRLTRETLLSDEQLRDVIIQTANNSHERHVFLSMLSFNKLYVAFTHSATFLPETEYPLKPYGIIFVVGAEFRGFHVRFADVARGGIRIIRSRNRENYSINQRTLFDENYGLARTQNLKNKDIPEGGSKGTILPNMDANPQLVFQKYVDSLLDLLIKGVTPGVKEEIVDLYGKEEILFLGPDEGTASFMDWGAEHARKRGAPWWKSFTTGKSAAKLGGIPHDKFGMTSLSIRQYVLGIYEKLNLQEQEVTKVQTGGPDGDLGSNEILLSSDKTIAIIDGSGVAHDPKGLDREELCRLARARQMVSNFDRSKLSSEGYVLLVDDRNVRLPSGEIVQDGVAFRNRAHLVYKADLFVPCGGRPDSVQIGNVKEMCDEEGKCNYKYIVEGANLFLSRQARLELEKRGVVLYPDASANKGGVTSSSLEVLVGLALSDSDYIQNMLFHDDKPTQFYMDYVRDIQQIIKRNARSEFEAIWREHEQTGKYRSVISTELSTVLIQLSEQIIATDLYDQEHLREAVLSKVFPETLIKKLGVKEVIGHVPDSYLRSAFAAMVAASFVYAKGPRASHVDFYNHIEHLLRTS